VVVINSLRRGDVGSGTEGSAATLLEQVHDQAMRASVKEATESLQRLLTGRIAAYVLNVKDPKTVARWAAGSEAAIRPESEQHLRAAYEIMTLLLRFEGSGTTRAWFLGMNPHLQDDAPADVLHEGRFREALAAAKSFVAYGANYS